MSQAKNRKKDRSILHQGQVIGRPASSNGTKPPVSSVEESNARSSEAGAEKQNEPRNVDFDHLLKKEKSEISNSRAKIYSKSDTSAGNLTGLSLSGGGIRSACFNLGLLEGLDRLEFTAVEGTKLKPPGEGQDKPNHLELFDYLSSVSGGSYAAGHLATASLKPEQANPHEKDAKRPEWLGAVPLTSKTVPGWLWGLGLWFLGVAFQLLKTGALLVCVLALVAFGIRILDAPDVIQFCEVLGLRTDVKRGFVPFWITLGIFLVAYAAYVSRLAAWVTFVWLGYSAFIVALYVGTVWSHYVWFHSLIPTRERLPYGVHYSFLMALIVPVVIVHTGIILVRGLTGLSTAGRHGRRAERTQGDTPRNWRWIPMPELPPLRTCLLIPLLVALFCVAGLVTTGDIGLASPGEETEQILENQKKSRELAEVQQWIINAALSMLTITSLAFFFPKRLLKSVRILEDRDSGKEAQVGPGLRNRGWEPIYRVVVYLCSYGFILLVIFVLYSTVARENVSGYYEWREYLPPAAFHPNDFRIADKAWVRIARDAASTDSFAWVPPNASPPNWKRLALRLMALRKATNESPTSIDLSLEEERARAAEIRALESMPWIVRLVPSLMRWGPLKPWKEANFPPAETASRLYDAKADHTWAQNLLAYKISESVLDQDTLYLDVPSLETLNSAGTAMDPSLHEKYLRVAKGLATIKTTSPGSRASIRKNNRRALQLYMPDLLRDREKKVVFAAIVWGEDQWTRLWIASIAGMIWIVSCAVDVNSYSLQSFYRGHVIDSWVKIHPGKRAKRWLHETGCTYRGHEYGNSFSTARPRRAPLLLINATVEGDGSRGNEPDPLQHIFTFSRIASGSISTGFWLNEPNPRLALAWQSNLDIGNIVATSGAFLSPDTVANPALSAILHLLNIQTGYWARDPKKFESRSSLESIKFHIAQSLGVDCNGDSRFLLTDGAHVENLGLFVLLQRRCSLIVASDCSQEAQGEEGERRFDALIQVLQQARVDGIEVGPFLSAPAYRHWLKTGTIAKDVTDPDRCRRKKSTGLNLLRPPVPPKASAAKDSTANPAPANQTSPNGDGAAISPNGRDVAESRAGFAQEHYVFSQIVYPDDSRGLLVYLRPTLTGDEGDCLLHGSAESCFPDDDPWDQFYTPSKMSTYRLLGRHIAKELMHDPVMVDALKKIVQGKAATEEPTYGKTDECEAKCILDCRILAKSCLSSHQRTFRPKPPRNDNTPAS